MSIVNEVLMNEIMRGSERVEKSGVEIAPDAVIIPHSELTECDIAKFNCEASAIGLAPGQWPSQLVVEPPIGNGLPLMLVRLKQFGLDGDVELAEYLQANGCVEVKVFND